MTQPDFREEAEKYADGNQSWSLVVAYQAGASRGYEVGKAERDDEALETVDKLIEQRDQLKQQLAEMKWEYENACKFATQFEQQRDEARKKLSELGNEYAIVCHLKQELVEREAVIEKLKKWLEGWKTSYYKDVVHLRTRLADAESAIKGFTKYCIKPECQCWACDYFAKYSSDGGEGKK
jgi:chromosome segregation ATPase